MASVFADGFLQEAVLLSSQWLSGHPSKCSRQPCTRCAPHAHCKLHQILQKIAFVKSADLITLSDSMMQLCQHFNPPDRTLQEIVLFCDRQEPPEKMRTEESSVAKSDSSKSQKTKCMHDRRNGAKACALHRKCNHTAEECTKIEKSLKSLHLYKHE